MCATWDEFRESRFEEDSETEEAMLCSMDIKENEQEEKEKKLEENSPSYVDLLCAFEELHDEMKKTLKEIIF